MTIIDNVWILSELKTEAYALKVCTHGVKNKVQFPISLYVGRLRETFVSARR